MKITKKEILDKIGGLEGLIDLLTASLGETITKNKDILENGRTERLFVGRWANITESLIHEKIGQNLKVDAPYNKHGDATKGFELDFAIHTRRIDDYNIFAMEAETNNYPKRNDIWKLKLLTAPGRGYEYSFGLFIVFGVEKKAGLVIDERWFMNGQDKTEEIGKPITQFLIKSTQKGSIGIK